MNQFTIIVETTTTNIYDIPKPQFAGEKNICIVVAIILSKLIYGFSAAWTWFFFHYILRSFPILFIHLWPWAEINCQIHSSDAVFFFIPGFIRLPL